MAKWVFLWGGVGRGKTRLLGSLVQAMPSTLVRRFHQHVFLDAFHRASGPEGGKEAPFQAAIRSLLGPARLLALDELHVYDIADAAILGRAFGLLGEMGVKLVITANHCPWALWPDTPDHARRARHFDPLVSVLRQRCDFVEVDSGRDYRDGFVEKGKSRWLVACTPEHDPVLWMAGKGGADQGNSSAACRFTFHALCSGHFGPADYAALCQRLPCLMLTGIPRFGPGDGDALRRLIWLADAAWEAELPLGITASAGVEDLFSAIGTGLEQLLGKDLQRTASRLKALVCFHLKA